MNRISGSSFLWLDETYSNNRVKENMKDMESWFVANDLESILKLPWGHRRLALGWLPVAQLTTEVSLCDLDGLCKIVAVRLNPA